MDNDMYDRETGDFFTLYNDSSTENPKWWADHVPIWTTLTHQGVDVSLHHWSKCQVPFKIDGKEILPKKCTPYIDSGPGNTNTDNDDVLREAFKNVTQDLKDGAIQAAFVYSPMLDSAGHGSGPDSDGTKAEVKKVDAVIKEFIDMLEDNQLKDSTNFIIVSDHGMTPNSELVV